MALIKCPECGQMISDKAESCPKCGYQMQDSPEKAEDGLSRAGAAEAREALAWIPTVQSATPQMRRDLVQTFIPKSTRPLTLLWMN